MAQKRVAVVTPVGVIRGRDAVYLNAVDLDHDARRVTLRGELNPRLCSEAPRGDDWPRYELVFRDVLALRMTELDLDDGDGPSSFDEVHGSRWLEALRARDHSAKVSAAHRHFVLEAYDDVFELIGTGFDLWVR